MYCILEDINFNFIELNCFEGIYLIIMLIFHILLLFIFCHLRISHCQFWVFKIINFY